MVPVAKKLELLAWELKQTSDPNEQKNILGIAYRVGGEKAIYLISARTGYLYQQLVDTGKLWELRKKRNRVRRGKGDGEGKLRREKELMAEAREIACQEAGFLGLGRKARRNTLSKTVSHRAAR